MVYEGYDEKLYLRIHHSRQYLIRFLKLGITLIQLRFEGRHHLFAEQLELLDDY